ncbi:major facilitator superfamily transporter, AGZA family, xanthine/uracil permease [Fusarium bulbicola]|nr:major facilitator superfamily transporter, AGZA family, xanthine/uracil permease [Fusarium bulbicola]
MGWIGRINDGVANSRVGHWFQLEGSGHPRERPGSRFTTEIRAGIISFFAMAYILAVNSSIVADSGGTCVCDSTPDDPICAANSDYLLCKNEVKRDLVTATAAISALATFFLGALANMPVGISCGMGLNAYLAYDVVGFHGSGSVPYEVAMTAIFVEGLIFFGLTILGLRQWLARAIPRSIKLATGAVSTPVELAGCSPADKLEDGTCPGSHKMQNPTLWLAIFCGGMLTVVLTMFRVKGAILIGIILVSICSWPRGTSITAFPDTPVGDDSFHFFKKVVDFHPVTRILAVQKWDISAYSGQFGRALITFLYVDILDCTGTLYSMARFSNLIDEKTQDFEGSATAYLVDSISITIGAVFGTSPVTAFIESGAGIGEGGRTGITAMMTGFCFFVSLFFAPIFASIPSWATGCVLILIGSMMMQAVVNINWRYMGDAIPAFLTIAIMPFTFSIADGLIAGICSYIVIQVLVWTVETASMGKLTATNKKNKDPWSWRIPGGILPGWLTRLFQGKKDFWRPYADETIDGNPGEPLPHVCPDGSLHNALASLIDQEWCDKETDKHIPCSSVFKTAQALSFQARKTSYESLDGTKIRLLRLHKGRFGDCLHGDFETVSLQDGKKNATPYEAVSYTWAKGNGKREKDHAVFIGKRWESLPITENCYDALQNWDTRNCNASDPRDKIFALLGLWKKAVEPDYTLSPQAMYTGLASTLVTDESWEVVAQLLDMATHGHSTPGLPSWVPDWSQKSQRSYRPEWEMSLPPRLFPKLRSNDDGRFRVHGQTGSLCILADEIDIMAPYLSREFRPATDGMVTVEAGCSEVSLAPDILRICEPTDSIFRLSQDKFRLILRKKAEPNVYRSVGWLFESRRN